MLDHCIEAHRREIENRQYRAYITDGVKLAVENSARVAGGSVLTKRWYDLVYADTVNDTRSGMEIARERLERFGITIK